MLSHLNPLVPLYKPISTPIMLLKPSNKSKSYSVNIIPLNITKLNLFTKVKYSTTILLRNRLKLPTQLLWLSSITRHKNQNRTLGIKHYRKSLLPLTQAWVRLLPLALAGIVWLTIHNTWAQFQEQWMKKNYNKWWMIQLIKGWWKKWWMILKLWSS